jgi:arsenate reductase
MAEGWARSLKADSVEPYSAGVEKYRVDPLAIEAMREVGVDISRQRSKHVNELLNVAPDYVVTVCDEANEACPIFPGGKTKIVHVGFDDPPRLAKDARDDEEAMRHYRRVRDEIKDWIATLPGSLP